MAAARYPRRQNCKSGPSPQTIRTRASLAATLSNAPASSARISKLIRLPGAWSRVTRAIAPLSSVRTNGIITSFRLEADEHRLPRRVVERQQHLAILGQAIGCLVVLCLILGE